MTHLHLEHRRLRFLRQIRRQRPSPLPRIQRHLALHPTQDPLRGRHLVPLPQGQLPLLFSLRLEGLRRPLRRRPIQRLPPHQRKRTQLG